MRTGFWWRSWHGTPSSPQWISVTKRAVTRCDAASVTPPGGLRVSDVMAIWWMLYDHASAQEDRGSVLGFDHEAAGDFVGIGEAAAFEILGALEDKGLVSGDRITAWDDEQPKREDSSAERTRLYRQRKKAASPDTSDDPGDDVTQRDDTVTPGDSRRDEIRRDEELPPPPPRARAELLDKVHEGLPSKYHEDLAAALGAVGRPKALLAELVALADGQHGPRCTWTEIGLGLHDIVAAGKLKPEKFSPRQLRRYVEGAKEQLEEQAAGREKSALGRRGASDAEAEAAFGDTLSWLEASGGFRSLTAAKYAELSEPVRRGVSAAGGFGEITRARGNDFALRDKKKAFVEAFKQSQQRAPETGAQTVEAVTA